MNLLFLISFVVFIHWYFLSRCITFLYVKKVGFVTLEPITSFCKICLWISINQTIQKRFTNDLNLKDHKLKKADDQSLKWAMSLSFLSSLEFKVMFCNVFPVNWLVVIVVSLYYSHCKCKI